MRRTAFLAAAGALALVANAHAATVPAALQIHTAGVTAVRDASGAYVITTTARAYRPLAGRRVIIACTSAARRLPAAAPPRTYITRVRAPHTRSPFRVRPARGVDLCLLDTASGASGTLAVPLSTRARRAVAEAQSGVRMAIGLAYVVAATRGHTSWPAASELPRGVRRGLDGLHYQTDGRRRMALSAAVRGGGAIFVRVDGDVVTTNLVGLVGSFGRPDIAAAAELPGGPFPPAGTPLPASTEPGVSATLDGREVSIAFDGSSTATAAYARLAGRKVQASCTPVPRTVLGLAFGQTIEGTEVDAPAQPTTLRFRIFAGTPAVCSLSLGQGSAPVVQVALGSAGPALLAEGLDSIALQVVAQRAAGDGLSSYATAASLEQSLSGGVVALASPGDTPGDRRIGVYSPGSRHLTVVVQALTGRRLFADFDGDVVTTNLGSVIDLLALV